MKQIIFLVASCFFGLGVLAQEENSKITIGINHTIKSSILNQNRTIQIYVPENYENSKKSYPVLYILDGQWYFLSGVAVQKALRTPGAIPEMIVVGIHNSNPLRRTLFDDEKGKFTNFLKNEVTQYIDSNYRTTKERVIFGWEAAAYYISELILKEKEFYSGAIITNGGYASEDLVKGFTSDKNMYLFMANSRKDIYYISSTDAFHEILKNNNPKNLIWKYELFNEEVHETLAHLALFKGLKYYYHNYDSPVFESIQHYIDMGGIDYLTTYFKERAKRFGGDGSIDEGTKNALIWLAWNRNDFEYFSFFMEEFKDVLTTRRYDSAYWKNRFGQFYLKHKDYKNAIKFFELGIKKYPNSDLDAEMKQGLSEAKNKI
ncbi:putative alpha/beta superfamily hydrolase [Saonia flava]|uniref:Putative alpha/beta superfamily hydrolase n=1 Tax=Saonia flava TaxID=523696 RepID=A0A846QP88_9FLAO|nr:alpha/beta hydrolase-fold protein [Saonia flava]NJB69928.1 putative alpha/beta superfamily hydrolase [Saonia flava]